MPRSPSRWSSSRPTWRCCSCSWVGAAASQGRRREPSVDQRVVRRARVDLPGGTPGRVARLHAGPDPDGHARHHVLPDLRAVDGLRGPPAQPSARGVRAHGKQRAWRSARVSSGPDGSSRGRGPSWRPSSSPLLSPTR